MASHITWTPTPLGGALAVCPDRAGRLRCVGRVAHVRAHWVAAWSVVYAPDCVSVCYQSWASKRGARGAVEREVSVMARASER